MSTSANPASGNRPEKPGIGDRFYQWLDQRTGMDHLLREALDEPIPGGAKYAYVFGSALLFVLLSQVITGVFLVMYYVPSAANAHTTVAYITKVVTGGSFIRSIHVYGADAMMILLILHMSQVFFYGAYKKRRELLWMSGGVLMLLIIGMAFTGYLLPWSERSYFATSVGTSLIGEVPWIGPYLKDILLGGGSMGTLTVSRFFVLHVFILPAAIFGFIAVHIYLFRKAGAAGPAWGDPEKIRAKTETFYPRQVIKDIVFVTVVIIVMGLLAYFKPADLGPAANPANTTYLPRPDWYFRPFFEWIRLWRNGNEFVAELVLPTIGILIFFLLPFIDRNPARAPRKRPNAVAVLAIGLCAIVGLGWYSYHADAVDPSVAKELHLQSEEDVRFMAAPFHVEMVGNIAAKAAPVNKTVAAGEKIFNNEGCSTCHGEGAVGTAIAPKLVGIVKKMGASKVGYLIDHENAAMKAGGMPKFNLAPGKIKQLVAYLSSLK